MEQSQQIFSHQVQHHSQEPYYVASRSSLPPPFIISPMISYLPATFPLLSFPTLTLPNWLSPSLLVSLSHSCQVLNFQLWYLVYLPDAVHPLKWTVTKSHDPWQYDTAWTASRVILLNKSINQSIQLALLWSSYLSKPHQSHTCRLQPVPEYLLTLFYYYHRHQKFTSNCFVPFSLWFWLKQIFWGPSSLLS